MDKSGLGTYKYPSKARYEGEWKHNKKNGSGIYYYPKGGLYKVLLALKRAFDQRLKDCGMAATCHRR